MNDQEIAERLKRDDEYWTGPRFMGLLGLTLAVALSVIYFISSVRSGDYTWQPFAHDPEAELAPSSW